MANDPVTQMVQDADFAKLPLADQRKALIAHDQAFEALDDAGITRFVKTHQAALSVPDPAAQAHAEMQQAIPTMQSIERARQPGAETDLSKSSPFAASGKRVAAIGEGYSDYMKQSGVFAGTAAGTAGAGAVIGPASTLLTRSFAAGAGAGAGALAGGATPTEAVETGGSAVVGQPIAEGLTSGVSALAKKILTKAPTPTIPLADEWRKINDVLGVKANAIRIGENATSLESAATMPGRALAKAGLTSEQLAKLTPLEQQQAIQPIRTRAAAELDAGFQTATDSGTVFDVGKSAFPIFKKIINPKAGIDLQQQAIDTFNSLAEEAGITNQRAATPQQARTLRQLLSGGARFQQGGDLGSLNSIRAELYRGVNRDLHEAVPGLQDLDQFYSDVKGASVAARNGVAKMATKAPEPAPPTFMQRTLDTAKREALPWAIRGAIGGGAYGLLHKLSDLVSPPAP